MKRFLAMFMVVILCFVLVVPAFAANNEWSDYEDEYPLYIMIRYTSGPVYLYLTKEPCYVRDDGVLIIPGPRVYYQYNESTDTLNFMAETQDGSFTGVSYDIIGSSYHVMKGEDVFFSATVVCDGTSCPATDWDYDNFCDDCGMTFAVLRSYLWPSFPDDFETNEYFIASDSSGAYHLYFLDTVSDVVYNTSTGELTPQTALYYYYVSQDETAWKYLGTHSAGSPISFDTKEFVTSTVDILDTNGSPFFPPPLPLWEEVEMVTQGEVNQMLNRTGGTMKILVVCGVGLMACLVVLSLFGKRSLIFRS